MPRISESFAASPAFMRRMQTRYRLGEEIADHSRAFQLARQLADLTFIGEAHADRDIAILGEPRGALWEEAWHVTEALIARTQRIRASAMARGSSWWPLRIRCSQVGAMAYPDQRLRAVRRAQPCADRLIGEA